MPRRPQKSSQERKDRKWRICECGSPLSGSRQTILMRNLAPIPNGRFVRSSNL